MNWTGPADVQAFLQRQWARGRLLNEEGVFPLRIPLKGPSSNQLSELFPQVQNWITQLRAQEGLYRLEWRTIRHRLLGSNQLPAQIWVDRLDQALELIGRQPERAAYEQITATTSKRCPPLLEWVRRRPLRALDLAEEWERILDVVCWVEQNPQSGLYIRQVDFPGVHTKFIETHKAALGEMLSTILPDARQSAETNVFERRFGFRERSTRVRFRFLDSSGQLPDSLTDISLASHEFAAFVPSLKRIFITENEINYLVFPPFPDSLVIFGAGYSIHQLGQADWLKHREIYYWGDIDTHGFAILDQLRGHFPQVRSLLMDQATLMAHRDHWVSEHSPISRQLPHLTAEEQTVYGLLHTQALGTNVRLEQEIIRYPWVLSSLQRILS